MYKYTIAPMPDPSSDYGRIILAIILFALVIVLIFCIVQVVKEVMNKTPATATATEFSVAGIAWCFGSIYIEFLFANSQSPENEEIIATRVTTQESKTSGKYPTIVNNVVYDTPDGIVTFEMGSGTPWPERVVLYRNKTK